MKHVIKTIALLIIVTISLQATAQTQEETKRWMEYSTPSDVQKMLAMADGEWDEDISFWMDPSQPEQKMKATCINKMILGGRYQEAKHTGDFGGMPFEGIGVLGWDNLMKKFVSTWIDNMGTGIMYMEGTWDETSKTATFKGKMTDPMLGRETSIRQVFKIVDNDTQELTQYQEKDGKENKTMYIKLMRKK